MKTYMEGGIRLNTKKFSNSENVMHDDYIRRELRYKHPNTVVIIVTAELISPIGDNGPIMLSINIGYLSIPEDNRQVFYKFVTAKEAIEFVINATKIFKNVPTTQEIENLGFEVG